MPESPSHPLEQLAAIGPWGGPSFRYRGAEIRCCPGGHVCGLFMPEHPLHGRNFGVVGTVTSLVDLWADLPEVMQAGRWKSPAMPARYAERLLVGRGAVAVAVAVARYYEKRGGR